MANISLDSPFEEPRFNARFWRYLQINRTVTGYRIPHPNEMDEVGKHLVVIACDLQASLLEAFLGLTYAPCSRRDNWEQQHRITQDLYRVYEQPSWSEGAEKDFYDQDGERVIQLQGLSVTSWYSYVFTRHEPTSEEASKLIHALGWSDPGQFPDYELVAASLCALDVDRMVRMCQWQEVGDAFDSMRSAQTALHDFLEPIREQKVRSRGAKKARGGRTKLQEEIRRTTLEEWFSGKYATQSDCEAAMREKFGGKSPARNAISKWLGELKRENASGKSII